jgi:hypothetical protein
MTALRWLSAGYGYEVTAADVRAAYDSTMKAADRLHCMDEALKRIRGFASGFVAQVLGRQLGI